MATRIPSHTQVLNDGNCLLADPEPKSLARTLYRGLAEVPEEERQRLAAEVRRIGGVEQHQVFLAVVRDCYNHCTR